MQYISEIGAFYNLVELKQLSTGQIALWHALMHINNRCLWQEWFTAPNLRLQLLTGLSRQGIAKNRNVLKQLGLINFKNNGTKATWYMLKSGQASSGSFNKLAVNELAKEYQESGTLIRHKTKTKTKDIPPCSPPVKLSKGKYGEYGNVLLTVEEQNRYIEDYGKKSFQAGIKILDEYLETSGKKYKNHNLVMRSWVLERLNQKQPLPRSGQKSMQILDNQTDYNKIYED